MSIPIMVQQQSLLRRMILSRITPNSIDKALYLTNEVYQEAKEAGYNCYAMTADSGADTTYPWGRSFMNYLAGGKMVDFSEMRNNILYLVGPGFCRNR